ncbi:FHF complex subunit HOOK-interacting protein 1A-like [Aplochiton taeniatus]
MMASVVVDGDRARSLTLRGVDPETCMIVFRNHWSQVVKILEKHEEPVRCSGLTGFLSSSSSSSSSSSGSGTLRLAPIPADEASAVQNYVEHILFLLMEEEAGQGGAMGPILEVVVMEGVMERLFLWSLRRQFTEEMKMEQLRTYQMLLSQARQPLLHHKPLLRPLMVLLSSCSGDSAGGCVEAELVRLLHQLCGALVRDPSVLELVFHTGEDQGATNFLLFSLLIPYTHRQGVVGQQARDALLLIMSLSASDPRVARHIAQNTYFCPVLATGLSGLYSSLPAKLKVYSEDWHSLERADWLQVPALVHFLHSLEFCSAVTKAAHPSIRTQLLGYIYNGFLVPVLAPALHKCTVEEVMTTTAYLDLFLRSISESSLLQTFLSFILLHTHDNVHILDTLVSRINTPFQLGTVSLALFRTLIGLFCEDVMLQLVLRYLIPCSHLSRRGRAVLTDRDWYSSSASAILILTPSWCPRRAPHTYTHTERIHWLKDTEDPLSDGDIVGCSRVIGSDMLIDSNYLHYLCDAGLAVSASHRACSVWSAPYDGRRPPPRPFHSGTPGEEEEEESPTPSSSSDTVSPGNRAGRLGGAELEWDDMFQEDAAVALETNGVAPPPAPPPHLQEMRRSAVLLLRGSSYVEESDFQDDVRVYDLVARSVGPATGTSPRQQRRAGPSGRTVDDIMTSHRRAQRKRSEDILAQPVAKGSGSDTNQVSASGPNSGVKSRDPDLTPEANSDHFLSLMPSLAAEPEGDDLISDIGSFRRRVRALRDRQEEEEPQEMETGWSSVDQSEEEEDEEGDEEEAADRRHGVPFTGPFLSVLLSRLENLFENPIPVNLLLTGILSQLATYPQPLLCCFLLHTHSPRTHSQPAVRTLYQVLVSLRCQIEQYAMSHPNFPALVTDAWRFLLAKDQDLKIRESLLESPSGGRGSEVPPNGQGVPPKLQGNAPPSPQPPPQGNRPPCPQISPQDRKRVFATILYAEFLKELAAIAQEHTIVP